MEQGGVHGAGTGLRGPFLRESLEPPTACSCEAAEIWEQSESLWPERAPLLCGAKDELGTGVGVPATLSAISPRPCSRGRASPQLAT